MKFSSKYTNIDKKIHSAQKLAEKMCERFAASNNESLPVKFWNDKKSKYGKYFFFQLSVANKLLKKYSGYSIYTAIENNPKVYSLSAKFLEKSILVEENKLKTIINKTNLEQQIKNYETNNQPQKNFQEKKSVLDRIQELE